MRRIYPLKHASEEVVAVAGAKCSRSPEPFDQIMAGISEEMAGDFHKKWVVGYGHASVAEMAVPMLALEGVSIVASKILESARRGAYQERSTRYQDFSKREVYQPTPDMEVSQDDYLTYNSAVKAAFDAYEFLTPKMMEWAEKVVPQDAPNRKGAVKGRAFDSLRYLLPCGTLTALAMRLNALDFSRMVTTLKSHRLDELNKIGDEMRSALDMEIPSLVRHADANEWLRKVDFDLEGIVSHIRPPGPPPVSRPGARLVRFDSDGELEVVSALLYRHSGWSYEVCRKMASQYRASLHDRLSELMASRGPHDPVPQEFENTRYVFDVIMDFGAYRDLQRHRRCTIYPQPVTPSIGYSVPDDLVEAGLHDTYEASMAEVGALAAKLEGRGSFLSQYATPLGYYHRSTHIYDLAQAYYVIELRTKPQGHISYRRIVSEMYNEIKTVHPFLSQWIRATPVAGIGVHS